MSGAPIRTSTIPSMPSSAAIRPAACQVPPDPIHHPPSHASGTGSVTVKSPRQVPLTRPLPRLRPDPHVSYYPSQPSSSAAIRPAACQVPPDHSTIPSSVRQVPPIPPLSARQVSARQVRPRVSVRYPPFRAASAAIRTRPPDPIRT